MIAGENGSGEVIEGRLAGRAPVALPGPLPLVMAMALPYRSRTADNARPQASADAEPSREIPGIVDQGLGVDQVLYRSRLLPADDGSRSRRKAVPEQLPAISSGRGHYWRANRPPTTPKRLMSLRWEVIVKGYKAP
jgi:hypothetical protein